MVLASRPPCRHSQQQWSVNGGLGSGGAECRAKCGSRALLPVRTERGPGKTRADLLSVLLSAVHLRSFSFAELWVPMDVAESPERDPRSPEDEEEEQQRLSDDDILRESGSDQDFSGAGGRASDLEDEDHAAPGLSQEEEESHSDEEDQDPSRGPASPPRGEEERASDLRDEASSVTRDLDEHELDYDEEVPEEPAPAGQEDEAEKAGAEDDEEKGDGAPGDEGAAGAHGLEDKEPLETAKEKSKEDDDGELDDGELDVSGGAGGAGGRREEAGCGEVMTALGAVTVVTRECQTRRGPG